jgi:hypothetical protein
VKVDTARFETSRTDTGEGAAGLSCALCFKQIWKEGKVGKVDKVGKVGREGLIMPTWNQL